MRAYVYLYGSLMTILLWLVLFVRRKDLRRQMLLTSLVTTPLAFSDLLFVPEYWRPITLFNIPIGIEGFAFCFGVGGVSAVVYESLFSKRLVSLSADSKRRYFKKRFLLLLGPLVLVGVYLLTPRSFMDASLLGLALFGFLIVVIRPDLFWPTVLSGTLFALFYTSLFVLMLKLFPNMLSMWTLENLSRRFIMGVPLEEILWSFLTGAAAGPLYEFWRGYRLV